MLQRSKNLTAQPLKVAALQLPCHLTQPFQIEWSMNMLTAEQIAAAQKANITTLFGLTTKAFEGMEKLIELNVQASKAAMAETADNVQAIMGAKDAQELLALQAALVQPLAEKTAANNAIESVQKAVKQASDMAETNMSSMAATATQATKTSARKR
jgi:phasin family protein